MHSPVVILAPPTDSCKPDSSPPSNANSALPARSRVPPFGRCDHLATRIDRPQTQTCDGSVSPLPPGGDGMSPGPKIRQNCQEHQRLWRFLRRDGSTEGKRVRRQAVQRLDGRANATEPDILFPCARERNRTLPPLAIPSRTTARAKALSCYF